MIRILSRKFGVAKKAVLPDLPYDYSELSPVLTKDLMETHHGKHHKKYVDDFNMFTELHHNAVEKDDHSLALKFVDKIKFTEGGHFNHSFLWESMSPVNKHGGILPDATSKLGKALKSNFGTTEALIERSQDLAKDLQGSGWIWMAWDPKVKSLILTTTKNQDTVSQLGLEPLLNIDVWEHAFYLTYLNRKDKYMQDIWSVVNWKKVEERFSKMA